MGFSEPAPSLSLVPPLEPSPRAELFHPGKGVRLALDGRHAAGAVLWGHDLLLEARLFFRQQGRVQLFRQRQLPDDGRAFQFADALLF